MQSGDPDSLADLVLHTLSDSPEPQELESEKRGVPESAGLAWPVSKQTRIYGPGLI